MVMCSLSSNQALTLEEVFPEMAYNANVNRIQELTFLCEQDGQAVMNILHCMLCTAQGDIPAAVGATSQQIWAAYYGVWIAEILPLLSNQLRYVSTTVREIIRVNPGPGEGFQPPFQIVYGNEDLIESSGTVVGGTVGQALPTYVAATLQKRGFTLERELRTFGSMRIGGIPEAATDEVDGSENSLGAAFRSGMNSFAEDLIQPISIVGDTYLRMGILNRREAAVGSALGGTGAHEGFAPWGNYKVNKFVGSQISRKRLNRPI